MQQQLGDGRMKSDNSIREVIEEIAIPWDKSVTKSDLVQTFFVS